jgi:hypothetical protein
MSPPSLTSRQPGNADVSFIPADLVALGHTLWE